MSDVETIASEDSGTVVPDEPREDIPTAEAPAFDVRISRDQVMVLLDCPDPLADLDATAGRILERFESLSIPRYPDLALLKDILQQVATPGEHLRDQPLIMGQQPTPAVDGRLDWARDFFAEGWSVDEETGAMDFWEKAEKRAVKEGEALLRVVPPTPGEPGLNVFGQPIPVGKPLAARVRCAKGVVETEDTDGGRTISAAFAGRVRYVNGTVAVDDVYEIRGDVSLETGNVHHTGAVSIVGDVKTGASIEADGDVTVKGMLEPCTITCGGTLTVGGGIVGDGQHRITVAGGLQAKYVTECVLKVGGDVEVHNEIDHTELACRGRVRVPEGRIAGGHVVAYKGIRVAEAGAGGSARTELVAGVDPDLPAACEPLREEVARHESARRRVEEALTAAFQVAQTSPGEQETLIAALKQKRQALDEALAGVARQLEQLAAASAAEAREEIVIYREVWSGTIIRMGAHKLVVRRTIEKPRLALRRKREVLLLPLGEGNMPDD